MKRFAVAAVGVLALVATLYWGAVPTTADSGFSWVGFGVNHQGRSTAMLDNGDVWQMASDGSFWFFASFGSGQWIGFDAQSNLNTMQALKSNGEVWIMDVNGSVSLIGQFPSGPVDAESGSWGAIKGAYR